MVIRKITRARDHRCRQLIACFCRPNERTKDNSRKRVDEMFNFKYETMKRFDGIIDAGQPNRRGKIDSATLYPINIRFHDPDEA